LKLQIPNWYRFRHDAVNRRFAGGLTFCNEFCVKGEYNPVAVYLCANPDRVKGHKDYLLLQVNGGTVVVRGMDSGEMEQYRYQDGVHCKRCDQVVYSVMRHDMRSCGCRKTPVTIDGGRDYCKVSFYGRSRYELVTIDLLLSKAVRRCDGRYVPYATMEKIDAPRPKRKTRRTYDEDRDL
jgi:hypothetical protein